MMNKDSQIKPKSKNWTTAITFLSLLTFFLILNTKMISPYILTILMGGILAILFYPFYLKLCKTKKMSSFWASMVVTISISLIVVVPVSLFTLIAVKQGIDLTETLSKKDGAISFDSVTNKINELPFVESFFDDPKEVKTKVKEYVETGSTAVAERLVNIVSFLPKLALHLFLAIVACFFFLIDGKRFLTFLHNKVPLDDDVREKIHHAFKNTAVSVIWATLAAAAAQSIAVLITFLLLGIPGAFLAGGATFILSWIPLIGFTPVLVAGCIYLYVQGKMGLLITLLIVGFFIGLLDNYIRPYILKGRDKTHPFISLIAIFGGISMFGIMGVFVGPVFAATLIALLQIWPTVGERVGLVFKHQKIPNSSCE